MTKKADLRLVCRQRWGKDWFKCHAVIKKARMAWADNSLQERGLRSDTEYGSVTVREGGDSYVV